MYKYKMEIYWSEADECFIAEVPELSGCMADGETPGQTLHNVEIIIGEWQEKAKELGIPLTFWSHLQKGETMTDGDKVYTPDMVMGEKRKGIKVTYVTDTRPLPIIAEQAKDADLFICEGMYGEPDKLAKAKEYKHMTFSEAASLAKEAQPKEMWLTHYSPSLIRPDDYMDKVREIFPRAKAARDGWTAELGFDEE